MQLDRTSAEENVWRRVITTKRRASFYTIYTSGGAILATINRYDVIITPYLENITRPTHTSLTLLLDLVLHKTGANYSNCFIQITRLWRVYEFQTHRLWWIIGQ